MSRWILAALRRSRATAAANVLLRVAALGPQSRRFDVVNGSSRNSTRGEYSF